MSDKTYIGKLHRKYEDSPQLDGYSKVVINVTDELSYEAGADTGRTLTISNPWGTQAMAERILASIRGYQYKPYKSTGAILDPSAELGDGITVDSAYGGIYSLENHFAGRFTSNVSAPNDEELDHEYPYVPQSERKITRQIGKLSSEFKIQSGLISAKVSRTGGDASSFGWELDESSWTIKASGTDILKATKDGLEVYGKVTATSGKIGGFAIENNALSTNSQTFGGTNSVGIYIGPSGIQLGSNFKVDSAGNLTATSGKFTGTVSAGNISYGGSSGYFSGSGISSGSIYGSRLVANTVSTAYTSAGINTSLGYADNANLAFNGLTKVSSFKISGTFHLHDYHVGRKAVTVATPSGGSVTLYYLNWSED